MTVVAPRPTALRADAAAILSARAVSLVAAAVQLPLLTRYLTPGEYAWLAAAVAAATCASLVAGDSTTLAFQRFPGSAQERDNYRFARSRLVRVVVPLASAALVAGAATDHPGPAVGVVGWAAGLAAMRFSSAAWLMWGLARRYAADLMVNTAVRTALLVGLVAAGLDASWALGVAGGASAVVALLTGPRTGSGDRATRPWPPFLGLTLGAASAAVTLLITVDLLLLPQLVDGAAAGRYAVMSNLAFLTVGAVLSTVNTAVFPTLLARWQAGDRESATTTTRRTVVASVAVAAAGAAVAALLGDALLPRVLGREFVDVPVLGALCGAVGLWAIGQHTAWVHNLHLRPRRIAVVALVAVVATLALVVPLALAGGAPGAAAAMVLGTGAYASLMQVGSGLGATPAAGTAALAATSAMHCTASAGAGAAVASVVVAVGATWVARGDGDGRRGRW